MFELISQKLLWVHRDLKGKLLCDAQAANSKHQIKAQPAHALRAISTLNQLNETKQHSGSCLQSTI